MAVKNFVYILSGFFMGFCIQWEILNKLGFTLYITIYIDNHYTHVTYESFLCVCERDNHLNRFLKRSLQLVHEGVPCDNEGDAPGDAGPGFAFPESVSVLLSFTAWIPLVAMTVILMVKMHIFPTTWPKLEPTVSTLNPRNHCLFYYQKEKNLCRSCRIWCPTRSFLMVMLTIWDFFHLLLILKPVPCLRHNFTVIYLF